MLLLLITSSLVFVESVHELIIPELWKYSASSWADGTQGDAGYLFDLSFTLVGDVIELPKAEVDSETPSKIPKWVKNNARWWVDGLISDIDYINGIQYLVDKGIILINVKNFGSGEVVVGSNIPKYLPYWLGEKWVQMERDGKIVKSESCAHIVQILYETDDDEIRKTLNDRWKNECVIG